MKCSELYRIFIKDGWYPVSQKRSYVKLKHVKKERTIIFPNHGDGVVWMRTGSVPGGSGSTLYFTKRM